MLQIQSTPIMTLTDRSRKKEAEIQCCWHTYPSANKLNFPKGMKNNIKQEIEIGPGLIELFSLQAYEKIWQEYKQKFIWQLLAFKEHWVFY